MGLSGVTSSDLWGRAAGPPTVGRRPAPGEAQNGTAGSEGTDEADGTDGTTGTKQAKGIGQKKLSREQEDQLRELKTRDTEVRAHEAAHAAAAGGSGGAPSFSYETGPDGKRYAVGGEVAVEIAAGRTAEETIRNAQRVRAAALAPATPSGQDRAVAADAAAMEAAARAAIAERRREEADRSLNGAEKSGRKAEPTIGAKPTGEGPAAPSEAAAPEAGSAVQSASEKPSPAGGTEMDLVQISTERRLAYGGRSHLHSDGGCGPCSAAVSRYRSSSV